MRRMILPRSTLISLVSLLALWACGESGTEPSERADDLDLAALFAPPSPAEVDVIRGDWANRDPTAREIRTEVSRARSLGQASGIVHVVSHAVDDARHFGAVVVPDGAAPASLPVLIYAHGGDGGIDVDDLLGLLPLFITGVEDGFVLVAPAFRSEPLVFEGATYQSGGTASPWDRDVDDAMALLDAVLGGLIPEADPSRVGMIGFSRGATVSMLMAVRDPRVDLVVEFFGATDFFGPFVREVIEEALEGTLRNLPGLEDLNQQFIQPLRRGETTIAAVRLEMVRRSPVYFAADLPDLQVHHGTNDLVVPVGEARRLIEVLHGLGRGEPNFESFIYPGGTHNPLTLIGSLDRTRSFLERLTSPAMTGAGSGGGAVSSRSPAVPSPTRSTP